jgi:hypothetical protein
MPGFQVGRNWTIANAVVVMCLCGITVCVAEGPSPRLATVNGHPVWQRDIDLELLISGNRQPTPEDRNAALERVIDRSLVAKFVAAKGTNPLAEDVENLVQFVRTGIESGGDTVDAVLGKLHLTEDDVRHAAELSVSWHAYVARTLTDKEIRPYFESHREQFDGTKVRLYQIVRVLPASATPAQWDEAEKLLADLRQQIQSGKIEFATAAAAHSTAPSAKTGGDIGWIGFQGGVPAPVSAAAFALKPGELSAPVRSTLGVHLVQITERRPGELSLEDARPAVLQVLGEQLWDKTVKTLRAKAKITKG